VLKDVKKLKVKNIIYLVKARKVLCELAQKTKIHKKKEKKIPLSKRHINLNTVI
jgi:hypothetical protein